MTFRLVQEIWKGGKIMKNDEKAMIILEHMEKYLQIDWAFEEFYIKGIMNGLRKIDEKEKGELHGDKNTSGN